MAQYQREQERLARARDREQMRATRSWKASSTRSKSLLLATLSVDDYIDFEALKEEPELPPFQPGSLAVPASPPGEQDFMPAPLSGMGKFVPGAKAKHEQMVAEATARYQSNRDRRQGGRDSGRTNALVSRLRRRLKNSHRG
jgi:restriction system protein